VEQITFILIGLLAMLISLSTHEFSHALAGYLLGDETAKRMGRLTLNPVAHIDPVGTILIPLIGAFSGLPLFGWAKPVPFNPYNLRYQKWGAAMVAMAGPISNIVLAFVYLFSLKFAIEVLNLPVQNLLPLFLAMLVVVNVVLAVFNLIPVPPLDGSQLLGTLLDSPKHRDIRLFLETKGPTILFIIIMLDFFSPTPVLGRVFSAAINAVFSVAGLGSALRIL
jgi:Zn-dependent protease